MAGAAAGTALSSRWRRGRCTTQQLRVQGKRLQGSAAAAVPFRLCRTAWGLLTSYCTFESASGAASGAVRALAAAARHGGQVAGGVHRRRA